MSVTKKYVSLEKLGLYDEKLKAKMSADDAKVLADAKAHAEGLATNYDPAGSSATVQGKLDEEVTRAKAREDEIAGLVATAQDEVDALEEVVAGKAAQTDLDALAGKVGEVPEGQNVMGIIQNIQENAYDDTELRGLIDNKADKTQVATDISTAVKAEEDARKEAVAGVQSTVDTLSQTHTTDKTALEGAIALKADQIALDEVSAVANAAVKQSDYDTKVAALEAEDARIAGLVETETNRATGAEEALDERLVKVEAFFEPKDAEGNAVDIDKALDTLVEIQKFITDEGSAADKMVEDIAANAKAIEDHVTKVDHNFAGADAALKAELESQINGKVAQGDFDAVEERVGVAEGKITTVENKVSTLEGEMDGVQAAVATKAEAQALTDAVAALEGADAELAGKIEALEGKFTGEGSVEDMIADAKQEAIDAAALDAANKDAVVLSEAQKYADAEDAKIETALAELTETVGTKAAQADLTALTGRVTTAEGEIDTLQTEMDAVEALAAANKAAHEANAAAIALKASQADLDAVSGRVTALETWHNNFTEVSEEEINSLFQ